MDEMDETDEIEILKKNAELTEDMSLTTERNTTYKIQAVCNNCNNRFKKYNTPHDVIFINRGNYDRF
jgi:hypothetical protein